MKKILLSAAIVIAACIGANAQASLGIKGGVNFSKINTDNLNSSTRTGYQAGLFARFGSALYLQPELYVSSTGGEFHSSNNNNNVSVSGNVKFTNLNVPLLVGHSFGEKNLNFRIMAGPVYTAVLSKNFSQSLENAYNDFGHYKSSTLGFQAGAGVDIGAITADLRYEGGLTKINSDFGQRQNLWALSVGFKIF
ncbi:porin family protein [Mucilaginibacter sp. L3T2-6]|uniref:porin family protein n=1 Tax=Mucilaginibacter sp. L3T2-6 TaxID=3062491 RepID=UPI0026773158|nr:porin family protein [Mucilaginibacter sp. L3T2-6]MDO3643129.1 porin family protein [Mucilaginibacter sp. L3T2-6]MDV6217745.1 porin family protein [Mucilaginibacter sp. L3T2-6]